MLNILWFGVNTNIITYVVLLREHNFDYLFFLTFSSFMFTHLSLLFCSVFIFHVTIIFRLLYSRKLNFCWFQFFVFSSLVRTGREKQKLMFSWSPNFIFHLSSFLILIQITINSFFFSLQLRNTQVNRWKAMSASAIRCIESLNKPDWLLLLLITMI